jgi:hypothetical protein
MQNEHDCHWFGLRPDPPIDQPWNKEETSLTSSARITMLSVSSLALALAVGGAAAQSLAPPYNSYAAKFSCGTATVDADVVKGTYATSINIHNPQSQLAVTFFKKVVTAPEEGQGSGRIVVLSKAEVLPADQAQQVDCPLIVKVLNVSGHIEGFVVIQVATQPAGTTGTPPALDVVGKYTARAGASGFDVVVYSPTFITR